MYSLKGLQKVSFEYLRPLWTWNNCHLSLDVTFSTDTCYVSNPENIPRIFQGVYHVASRPIQGGGRRNDANGSVEPLKIFGYICQILKSPKFTLEDRTCKELYIKLFINRCQPSASCNLTHSTPFNTSHFK